MLSPNTQAILLLTCHFAKGAKADAKPLGNKEWNDFALWLRERGLTPEKLVQGNPEQLLDGWSHSKITPERIMQLLNRGSALALSVEKWLRSGLWIITRSDPEYPKRLKMHVKGDSPPVLFGCGKRSLLNQGGLAVVGSRKTVESDMAYSRSLGQLAAEQGYSLISGGAAGVDEASMLGALAAEGTAVGILANDLLRAASSAKFRQHLLDGNLALISPFYPEAGFNVGNAMQRNKYIYCLADAAVAVHSGTSGGTWTGVLENLKKAWVPMWIKPTDDPTAGNDQLVKQGAAYISEPLNALDLGSLKVAVSAGKLPESDIDLLSQPAANSTNVTVEKNAIESESALGDSSVESDQISNLPPRQAETEEKAVEGAPEVMPGDVTNQQPAAVSEPDFYELFLIKLARWCANDALDVEQLLELSGLHKSQLTQWLHQAIEEKHVVRLSRPVRYRWSTAQQIRLFEGK